MTYNSATRTHELTDASGSYSWIWESLHPSDYFHCSFETIDSWAEDVVINTKEFGIPDFVDQDDEDEMFSFYTDLENDQINATVAMWNWIQEAKSDRLDALYADVICSD